MPVARLTRVVLLVSALLITFACAATPRFPPAIQSAIVHSDMQRLETEKLVLYYPAGARDEALRIGARLEYCRSELEKYTLLKNGPPEEKSVFVLPEIELNNAYVAPPFGMTQIAVLPLYATANVFFMTVGIPPDAGTIGCHEMVHDIHARQVSGAAKAIRTVLGHYYTPQSGLDPWFWEGLAVYFETKLQGIGRLNNPYFDGHFAAGVAGTTVTGDDLNYVNRATKFGAMYLVGSHFVDYLARTYGEEKLWQIIKGKSGDIAFPLGVSNLFKQVYGKNLSALIDDFAADTKVHYPVRQRPGEQRTVRYHEQNTDIYWGLSGHSVVLTQGLDQQARVTVLDPEGHALLSHLLNDLGVGRRLIATNVDLVSGLSITADGKHVYFVAADVAAAASITELSNYESRLVHIDVDNDELEVLDGDMHGSGGSVSPDGSRYYFSRAIGDSLGLFYYELATRVVHALPPPPPRMYHASPMVSPDGSKLLVTEASDDYFHFAVYDALSGERLSAIAAPEGIVLQASWVDDTHVVYAGVAGRRMQIFETDLDTGQYRQLTDAPYAVARPFVHGSRLRFLNREHWSWTEDEVDYPAPAVAIAESQSAVDEGLATGGALEEFAEQEPVEEAIEHDPSDFTFAAYASRQRPVNHDVTVVSEKAYSGFERLFIPQAWGPFLTAREDNRYAVGAFLSGGDTLGYHRWGLYGAWDTHAKLPTVGVSYVNSLAAPFRITLDGAVIGREEADTEDLVPAPNEPVRIRETLGSLALERDWYASLTTMLGGRYIAADYERVAGAQNIAEHELAGPMAGVWFRSTDSTPYGGVRRGFSLGGMGTYFPASIGSVLYDITDARGELAMVFPLPFSRRHRLMVSGSGRALLGSPEESRLLQLGGGGNATLPVRVPGDDQIERVKGSGVLPPGLRFFESLRGFEDHAIFGRYAATGEASYRYPFIFDWGTASTLRFLPATALRQIDVDLFFSGASLIDKGRESAFASGAALHVRLLLWQAPVTVTLQGAQRLTYDEDFAFYFALGSG